jgi:diguanylate cyclase (GGDEF)-like protein
VETEGLEVGQAGVYLEARAPNLKAAECSGGRGRTLNVEPSGSLVELWDAFGSGVYLLFGVIHLDLWLRRRDRLGHLWLAGASFSALAVDLTGMAIRRFEPPPMPWVDALNTLGVAAATVFLFELVSFLGHRPTGRFARLIQASVLLAAPLPGLFFPPLAGAVYFGCFALLIWAMVKAILAARDGDKDSGMVAKGFMVLTACLLGDLLNELHLAPFPSGLPLLGFIVLFLASARSLNDRFGREEEASRTDSMTGLWNRRGFLEASDGALVRSRRSGKPVSIALGDLDHFKEVNDSLGHAAGDAVLKAVAGAIRASLRAQDVAARWGGEEFILLLPDTPKEGALHVAECVRRAIAALPIEVEGQEVKVTLSMGVAQHWPGRNLEETIAQADAALYRAKDEGRNRVEAT